VTNLPPAGWYDDPTSPGQERWWDGDKWSEQTRRKVVEEYRHRPGDLRRVSDFLGHSFGLIRERWDDFLLIAGLAGIAGAVAASLLLRPIVAAVDIVDNQVVGFEFTEFALLFFFVVVSILLFVVVAMAQHKIAWEAATGESGSWSSALAYGTANAARLIGWGMIAVMPLVAVAVVWIWVVAIGPGAAALSLLILVVGVAWWSIVLSFLPAALVVLPRGDNPIPAAFAVVRGRWWRIFGRLLLMSLIVGLVGQVVGAIFAQLVGTNFFGIELIDNGDGTIDIVKNLGGQLDFFVGSLATLLLSYATNIGQIAAAISIAHDVMPRPEGTANH